MTLRILFASYLIAACALQVDGADYINVNSVFENELVATDERVSYLSNLSDRVIAGLRGRKPTFSPLNNIHPNDLTLFSKRITETIDVVRADPGLFPENRQQVFVKLTTLRSFVNLLALVSSGGDRQEQEALARRSRDFILVAEREISDEQITNAKAFLQPLAERTQAGTLLPNLDPVLNDKLAEEGVQTLMNAAMRGDAGNWHLSSGGSFVYVYSGLEEKIGRLGLYINPPSPGSNGIASLTVRPIMVLAFKKEKKDAP